MRVSRILYRTLSSGMSTVDQPIGPLELLSLAHFTSHVYTLVWPQLDSMGWQRVKWVRTIIRSKKKERRACSWNLGFARENLIFSCKGYNKLVSWWCLVLHVLIYLWGFDKSLVQSKILMAYQRRFNIKKPLFATYKITKIR